MEEFGISALPSSFSCSSTLHSGTTFGVNGQNFNAWCQHDTTGPVLSISEQSLYDCAVTCSDTPACKAASWRYGTCYLKSAIGEIVANEHVTSFTISVGDTPAPASISCPADNGKAYGDFTVTCGTDYPGVGDIGSSSQPTFEKCIDACGAAAGCVAVVYSGDACYLKSSIGPVTEASHLKAAVKTGTTYTPPSTATGPSCPADDGQVITSTAGRQYSVICDKEYSGGDLSFAHADTFAQCIAACDANTGCIDVSYHGSACYMKNKLTTLATAPGLWTAQLQGTTPENTTPVAPTQFNCPATGPRTYKSKTSTTETSFQVDCSTDYFGGDFLSLDTPTLEKCADACASHAECLGASYRGTGCYLKSKLNTPAVDTGVIGIKRVISTVNALRCDEAFAYWGAGGKGGCNIGCYCNAAKEGLAYCVDDRASLKSCKSNAECPTGEFCDVGSPANRVNPSYSGVCDSGKSCSSTYVPATKRGLLTAPLGGSSARGLGSSVFGKRQTQTKSPNYVALLEIISEGNSTASS